MLVSIMNVCWETIDKPMLHLNFNFERVIIYYGYIETVNVFLRRINILMVHQYYNWAFWIEIDALLHYCHTRNLIWNGCNWYIIDTWMLYLKLI